MAPEARRRVLWTCVLGTFTAYLCLLFLTPIYPEVARDLRLGPDSLSLLLSIAPALSVVANLPVGVLTDRLGRRPLLLAGAVLLVGSQLLLAAAATPVVFGASRLVIGLAIPFVASASYAAVADAHPGAGRVQALGLVTAAVSLGQAAGYVSTAGLDERLGWHLLALALLPLPALMFALSLRMPEPPAGPSPASAADAMGSALSFLGRPPNAAAALVATFVNGAGVSATFLLPFATRSQGLGTTVTALLLLVFLGAAVVSAPLVGRLADRTGAQGLLRLCLAVCGGTLAVFAVAGPRIAVIVPVYAVTGGMVAASAALNTSQVVQAAQRAGTGTGAALGGLRLGQVLGPALVMPGAAVLYTRAGLASAVVMLAALCGVALLLTLVRSPQARTAPAFDGHSGESA